MTKMFEDCLKSNFLTECIRILGLLYTLGTNLVIASGKDSSEN